MVTKKKIRKTEEPQGRVKVGKLKLDRETVKNLTGAERKEIKGGARPGMASAPPCACATVSNRAN